MNTDNKRKLTKTELFACMLVCYFAPSESKANGRGIPALLSSKPGKGKSSLVREFAAVVGADYEQFAVGLRGEGALGVTPVYSDDAEAIVYPTPSWVAPHVNPRARAIINVDELNTAGEDLQPGLLALLLDKMIGADQLGANCRMFGCQNPPGAGGANTHEIPAALANRLVHLPEVAITTAEFGDHLSSYRPYGVDTASEFVSDDTCDPVDAAAIEGAVDAEFMDVKAKWAPVVTAFLSRMPQFEHTMPDEMDAEASQAWASNRSWKMALNLIVTAEIMGTPDYIRDILIEGCIGEAPTIAFVEYASKLDLPDAAKLLDGKVTWQHDPVRPDITGAVLSEVVRVLATDDTNQMKRAEAAWSILGEVSKTAAELVHRPGRELMARKLYKSSWKGVKTVHAKTGAMLSVAGLLKKFSKR